MSLKNVLANAVLVGSASLMAVTCGPSPEKIAELEKNQKEILAKLGEVIPKIDKIAARPAAPPRRNVPGAPTQPTCTRSRSGIRLPRGRLMRG